MARGSRRPAMGWKRRGSWRKDILSELDRWCDEGPPVAVRLLHAEGGMGKTRLALEWMRQRREKGWVAGLLAETAPDDWFEYLWVLERPVVVVLDCAEDHSELRDMLLRVLRYASPSEAGGPRSIRILLLARNAGDWWQSLRRFDTALGAWLDTTPPLDRSSTTPFSALSLPSFKGTALRTIASWVLDSPDMTLRSWGCRGSAAP